MRLLLTIPFHFLVSHLQKADSLPYQEVSRGIKKYQEVSEVSGKGVQEFKCNSTHHDYSFSELLIISKPTLNIPRGTYNLIFAFTFYHIQLKKQTFNHLYAMQVKLPLDNIDNAYIELTVSVKSTLSIGYMLANPPIYIVEWERNPQIVCYLGIVIHKYDTKNTPK